MMIVASFNVNSIRARMPVLRRWLDETGEKPDLLCLQETKVQDRDFPVEEVRELGYIPVFRGEKSYNGVAILSLQEPEDVHYGFNQGEYESRLIRLRYRGWSIVNTYVPQGRAPDTEPFTEKLGWFGMLHALFEKYYSKDEKLIWCGDLNVAPEDRDVHNPKRLLGQVGFHPDEHRALKSVMGWGFVDIFRKHVDREGEFTFWDYRAPEGFNRNLGWRVDHILGTGEAARLSRKAWIDREPRGWERPSDHTPILAEFNA